MAYDVSGRGLIVVSGFPARSIAVDRIGLNAVILGFPVVLFLPFFLFRKTGILIIFGVSLLKQILGKKGTIIIKRPVGNLG